MVSPLRDDTLYLGTDGHVGSIYPNQEDVKSKRVVVPVTTPISKVIFPSLHAPIYAYTPTNCTLF